jgi:hypothetical protein
MTAGQHLAALRPSLIGLRDALDRVYAPDTASLTAAVNSIGWFNFTPSTGHCAVTAIVVRALFGGDFLSASVSGVSHWFNSIPLDGALYDVDITGDQFGRPRVQIQLAGLMYGPTRVRGVDEIRPETWARHTLLVARLGDL